MPHCPNGANGIIIPNGLLYLKYLYVCIPTMAAIFLLICEKNIKQKFRFLVLGKFLINRNFTILIFPILHALWHMHMISHSFHRDILSLSSENRTKDWIEWNLQNYEEYGFGLWAVVLRETDEFIGDCGLTIQNIDGESLPEIGYHIHKNHWRKGFGSEAASEVKILLTVDFPF